VGRGRTWTAEEVEYLKECWGRIMVPNIAQNLGRPVASIIQKASRIGLGNYYENGDYITLNQLYVALRCRNVNSYIQTSWIKNRGLPIRHKRHTEKGRCCHKSSVISGNGQLKTATLLIFPSSRRISWALNLHGSKSSERATIAPRKSIKPLGLRPRTIT